MSTPYILVRQSDLELDASQWITNISSPVNKQMSLLFQASSLADGRLLVTNAGNVPYAGGLVSRKSQVPQFVGNNGQPQFLPYAQLSTNITIPSTSMWNLARLETDLIAVFVAPVNSATQIINKANCSTQLNLETGHFEVDASPGSAAWTDIGDGPGTAIQPDMEHSLVIKCAFDFVANTRVVQSVTWDDKTYPAGMVAVNQPSNWGQVASIQKQTEILQPGVAQIIYRATELAWSNQEF